MSIEKLLTADFTGKGVSGLPDTPNLSAGEMQAKFDELAKDVLAPKLNEVIDEIADEAALRAAHETDRNNPDAVTKAQVGLGNADNTADAQKPVSVAQEARITEKFKEASAATQAHVANRQNPHGVSPEQIGAATPEFVRSLVATAGGSSGGLPSHSLLVNREDPDQHPIGAISGLTTLLEQAAAHRQSSQNPHGVTAQQCGAVPLSCKVNGKTLSADVQLVPSDLGIVMESGTWTPTLQGNANVGDPSFIKQSGTLCPYRRPSMDQLRYSAFCPGRAVWRGVCGRDPVYTGRKKRIDDNLRLCKAAAAERACGKGRISAFDLLQYGGFLEYIGVGKYNGNISPEPFGMLCRLSKQYAFYQEGVTMQMEETVMLELLTQDSVSVKTQKVLLQNGTVYQVGCPHRCAYVNSVLGRQQLLQQVPQPYCSAVLAVWGAQPTVEETK